MKKFILVFFMYILIFENIVFANELEKPKVDASSAILLDYKTGKVLWEKNSHEPMSIASTTKIMTAIVALENSNMNDIVTVSKKAASAPPVKMHLKPGEKIKLEYLMQALMMQSSNDAAVAIAEHVGGSVENFCNMMTDKAKSLGAKDTLFVTPNGLDAGDHHSTAYDLAVISKYALENKEFMKLINTKSVTCNSDISTYAINNKNRLLNEMDGANGIKSGFTGKAGHCFVGSVKRDGMQLISVVLASGWGDKGKEQKWRDTKEVLNYGFKTFKYRDIIKPNINAGTINIDRSKTPNVGLYYFEGLMIPLSDEEFETIKIEVEYPEVVKAPIEKDQKLGVAKVFINGTLYKEIDLLTDNFATRHDLKTCMEKVINNWLSMGTSSVVDVELPEF